MKKVLSVAMASAMVLGMGANAFAIEYSTQSNDKASWPTDFQFYGELFVTDKNGDIIEESTTDLNTKQNVDFQPGDTIWMPLYAKNQVVYDYEYNKGESATDDKTVKGDVTITVENMNGGNKGFYKKPGTSGWLVADDENYEGDKAPDTVDGYYMVKTDKTIKLDEETTVSLYDRVKVEITGKDADNATIKYYIAGDKYRTEEAFKQALAEQGKEGAYVTVTVAGKDGTDSSMSGPIETNKTKDFYNYTGKIDKNWSINLIEKSTGVAELIEDAELYRATPADVESYSKYADVVVNGVYLKINLKEDWKFVSNETLKYYVYVANNKNNADKTNEVWVSGKYAPTYRTVDFTWSNNANEPALWKAEENGTAVFDFADKAFFTVKMYKGETMYLDLNTAYNKAIEGEFDAEFDSFYKFDSTNANFSRTGELVIASDDENLSVYEINEDGDLVAVDAEYVKDYKIAGVNKKVNGFKFDTKQLGNYVLSEELAEEEEVAPEEDEEKVPEVEETPEVEEVPETNKPNPETGAEDFVGLAVSLAVVSVAAAGALALKK